MMTMTSVKAVVKMTLHSCKLNQRNRQVGRPTTTKPNSWTPWLSSDNDTQRIVPTNTAASAQGRRGFIFSPTVITANVPRASTMDHTLTWWKLSTIAWSR